MPHDNLPRPASKSQVRLASRLLAENGYPHETVTEMHRDLSIWSTKNRNRSVEAVIYDMGIGGADQFIKELKALPPPPATLEQDIRASLGLLRRLDKKRWEDLVDSLTEDRASESCDMGNSEASGAAREA